MSPLAYYGLFYTLFITLLLVASCYRHLARVFQILVWLLLTLFSGLRVGVGRDYLVYVDIYTNVHSPTNQHIEPIWNIINSIFRHLEIPMHIWLICIAGATYFFVLYGFKRWGINWIAGIFCYVLIYKGFFESMNIVRQCLASSIVFAGTPLILERRWGRFALWVFAGFLFHSSALIGGIILLFASKAWSRRMLNIGLIVSLITGIYLFPALVDLLKMTLPGKYTVYLEGEYLTESSTGLYRIFLLLFSLFLINIVYPLQDRKLSLMSKMIIFSVFIYNALYIFEPGVRLMLYPFTGIFYIFPLIARDCPQWNIKAVALSFFFGFGIFSFKSLFTPEEPYIKYQTVFEQSLPIPDVPKEIQNTISD